MKAPALAAVMERRILINYRVDPDLLGSYLPAPFRRDTSSRLAALAGGRLFPGHLRVIAAADRPVTT
jgi:hypothetical protein